VITPARSSGNEWVLGSRDLPIRLLMLLITWCADPGVGGGSPGYASIHLAAPTARAQPDQFGRHARADDFVGPSLRA